MASYTAADCPFLQDADRRMAPVIAHIRRQRAEERKRADRAQDDEYVNGEKLLSSLSSVKCKEVKYAMERYSESPPPVTNRHQDRQC